MKVKHILLICFLSFLLCFEIFALVSLLLVNNLDFYKAEFKKNQVYETFGNETYVNSVAGNLVDYLYGNEKLMQVYDEKEVKHLVDVKNVIGYLKILFNVILFILCLVFSFLFYRRYKYLWLIFVFGFCLLVFVLLLLYLFSLTGFMSLFTGFHKVLFTEGSWILDNNSTLIGLFPEEFFMHALVKILLYSFIIGLVFLFVGLFIRKRI